MTIETDFLELMTQTCTVEPFSSNNEYGEPSFGTAVSYSCRTVHKTNLIRTIENKEITSIAQTWIYGSPGISPKDRITLPDGTTPKILRVDRFPDENGNHHDKVWT